MKPGTWVAHNLNRGVVVATDTSAVFVRWIDPKTPFYKAMPQRWSDPESLVEIAEPRLTAREAARYIGRCPARIYQYNKDERLGSGGVRNPCYATPTELETLYGAIQTWIKNWSVEPLSAEAGA